MIKGLFPVPLPAGIVVKILKLANGWRYNGQYLKHVTLACKAVRDDMWHYDMCRYCRGNLAKWILFDSCWGYPLSSPMCDKCTDEEHARFTAEDIQ